jgi:predicted nucleotidyltransferase
VTTPAQVVARRRRARRALVGQAREFVDSIDVGLGVRGAAVFGSVARGDWNDGSDVDVVVIVERPPSAPLARLAAVGTPPGRVEPIVWSVEEWRRERRRGNPIAAEAADRGIWLLGSAEDLG